MHFLKLDESQATLVRAVAGALSASVEMVAALVVLEHQECNARREMDSVQQLESRLAVHPDHRHLKLAEVSWIRKQLPWSRQLANVMDSRCRHTRHSFLVTGGIGVMRQRIVGDR